MSGTVVQTLRVWQQRAATRRSLRRQLEWSDSGRIEKDIGLRPGSLDREARKPFWMA
ncbi:DUF1127 domain-containing protein [Marinobacter sp. JSM 1782161]|uniref:DUF1127 domain-containing protein n=1 Tax=Marinobacter sp. JSM 1782161 TaxID=2685906 RepID=UPI0014028558|nr:hypothetical protein [Marinobacter sp. JSM 1782161]